MIDIQQLIEDAEISSFLPVLPDGIPSSEPDDFGSAPYDFTYAYQNYFPTNTRYEDPDPSLCNQVNYTHNVNNFNDIQNGVSLIIRPDYDFNSDKFQYTFQALDQHIDGGDGQNCGKFRVITYPNWVAMYIYNIGDTKTFSH